MKHYLILSTGSFIKKEDPVATYDATSEVEHILFNAPLPKAIEALERIRIKRALKEAKGKQVTSSKASWNIRKSSQIQN